MKTPAEIARDVLGPTIADDGIAARVNHSLIYRWVERAIELDRAQLKKLAEGARASVNYNIDNKRTMTDESLTAVKRLCDALGV